MVEYRAVRIEKCSQGSASSRDRMRHKKLFVLLHLHDINVCTKNKRYYVDIMTLKVITTRYAVFSVLECPVIKRVQLHRKHQPQHFPPGRRGCSEGLDAFIFFSMNRNLSSFSFSISTFLGRTLDGNPLGKQREKSKGPTKLCR